VKAVVVHRGGRDHYQVAQALDESGALEALITDLYWPGETSWARAAGRVLPAAARRVLAARWAPGLDHRKVQVCGVSGVIAHAASILPGVPFPLRRRLVRWSDHVLGREAQRIASGRAAAILSYSYYAYAAFTDAPAHLPRILFQLHPHPASVRRILLKELEAHPECRDSVLKEWELALPEEDFRRLVEETRAADGYIVASSFTRQTLVENGISPASIEVIPYGVDLDWFTPGRERRDSSQPLRLLFVGRINQRKGIRYLVEALERLDTSQVHLTICGRVVDDLSALRATRAAIEIRPDVSAEELRRQYRMADVFVLPSLAEGFGHVLLEALACGVPVITTTRSAGPDIIRRGREGFVIEPADSNALADRLQWCLDHRSELAAMRHEARTRAEAFPWSAFRSKVAAVVEQYLGAAPQAAAG
jgi:glycosyltransferase involved in cell wall biosynthesis